MADDVGNIDMPFGGGYEGVATANVEDSVNSLFREIGTTLKDVTKQGISTVQDTVKTALANKIMASPQGQSEIAKYKMEYFFKYLPWALLIVAVTFVAGKWLSRT